LRTLHGQHTLLFDASGLPFAEPYSIVLVSELDRRGFEIVVDDVPTIRQLGPTRRFTGRADGRLFMRVGSDALVDQPGATRVALTLGLTPAEQRERALLHAQLLDYIGQHGLPLTDVARRDGGSAVRADADTLLSSGTLNILVQNRYLELDATWQSRFARFAELEQKWDLETVGVFVAPLASRG
jgi:hypothetical protein